MEIIKIKDERFYNPKFKGYVQPKGEYCFKDDRGYVAFKDYPYCPYIPCGSKKALQRILDTGGFIDESDLVFIQPMKEV